MLLTEANSTNAPQWNILLDKIPGHSVCAPAAQIEVVFERAGLVREAVDFYNRAGQRPGSLGNEVERSLCIVIQACLVECKCNVSLLDNLVIKRVLRDSIQGGDLLGVVL